MTNSSSNSQSLGLAFAFCSSASNAAAHATFKAVVQCLPHAEVAVAFKATLTAFVFFGSLAYQGDAQRQISNAVYSRDFRTAVIVSGLINVIASQLSQYGLRKGELGDTLPFLSFTPAFLLVAEFVLLHEAASLSGVLGVLLVSAGGFLLSRISSSSKSVTSGSKGFVLPPGAGIFTAIAIIYSISSAFDKRGVGAAPPLLYGATIQTAVAIGAFISWLWKRSNSRTTASSAPRDVTTHILIVGEWLLSLAAYWCQLQANQYVQASHLSAIRRAGCLFGLLLGRMFFQERVAKKVLPVTIMVFGVCVLTAK
eukprot:gnl/TRDRNA2_/TRDRNA2_205984_c0_seq1.p1 gnl/TRDRNA2_/TRDRNA2_205984_c0~~gnl/TRDRNA2_/TRDRNA2_205984_c0_seq1.p1  ORF type:complete len:311 (-),score=33.69 gnl/TRDRNA2_/TRDRNA2_205984_c0_seq1:136-1068(-)